MLVRDVVPDYIASCLVSHRANIFCMRPSVNNKRLSWTENYFTPYESITVIKSLMPGCVHSCETFRVVYRQKYNIDEVFRIPEGSVAVRRGKMATRYILYTVIYI